ncbi:hypothetical protein [uncultured Campylobacter sp.]|uniref:hypothetical protein n=1 Tax=uncultured Campylobacter sp. TaxID=218934 RepID=UPI002614AC58|nr:hypothetical protein [uncultured Campylobacter sp.]
MSDPYDYYCARQDAAQVARDVKFNEFCDQVADIIATARDHLSKLADEYEELISFDDLADEINWQIDDNLKF